MGLTNNGAGKQRKSLLGKDQTRLRIEKMEAEREERRRVMQERKRERAQEEQRLIAQGNPGDVDFIGMVRKWRQVHESEGQPHDELNNQGKICICVRKRPVSEKERVKKDHDSVTCFNPVVWVHNAKLRVDGITKYLDHSSFKFDHGFDETATTEDIYKYTTMPLLDFVVEGKGGRATVFAYGQTGSGKTYTMNGIQNILCEDLFLLLADNNDNNDYDTTSCSLDNSNVTIAFFELYGGYVQDLLNSRKRLKLLEDGKGEIVITGLEEFDANSPEEFQFLIHAGNQERTTHTTEANDTSSRSHAICQISLRDKATNKLKGKLSLVDLAGSERGTDTKSHNAQRRAESAEINTSLLSLKECIRALGTSSANYHNSNKNHVPYRGSKLTLLLKDCFTSNNTRTAMIATISPGASAVDHTLNTLRYADRIKEQRVGEKTVTRGVSDRTNDSSFRKEKGHHQPQNGKKHHQQHHQQEQQQQQHQQSLLIPSTKKGHHFYDGNSKGDNRNCPNLITNDSFLDDDYNDDHNTSTNTKDDFYTPLSSSKTKNILEDELIDDFDNDDDDDDFLLDEKPEQKQQSHEISIDTVIQPVDMSIKLSPNSDSQEELETEFYKKEQGQQQQQQQHQHHVTHSNSATKVESSKNNNNDVFFDCIFGKSDTKDDTTDILSHDDHEAELRKIVKAMFEQEELILNLHMANIQENAELLTEEGKMLQEVQRDNVSKSDVDLYVLTLREILDRKEYLIRLLQDKVETFRSQLQRERDLSNKVQTVGHF